MNRKILLFNIAICLLLVSNFALAVTITNPLAPGGVWTFGDLIGKIIQAVSGVVAGLAIIMFMIAGILFLTSAGSPEKLTKARTAAVYATVGLTIAIAAAGIVQLIQQVTGATP